MHLTMTALFTIPISQPPLSPSFSLPGHLTNLSSIFHNLITFPLNPLTSHMWISLTTLTTLMILVNNGVLTRLLIVVCALKNPPPPTPLHFENLIMYNQQVYNVQCEILLANANTPTYVYFRLNCGSFLWSA